jgi:uncharacterized protein (DUF736 family)
MCGLPTVHSGASGVRLRLRRETAPPVSPAFARFARCKPGDPPPPSRPAAARASNRIGALSRPHTGASLAKGDSHDYRQFHLQQAQDTYTGGLGTLSIARKVVFRPSEATSDKAPSYRVVSLSKTGDVEFGAAWKKRSEEGRDYLSVRLDDPSLAHAINCALVGSSDHSDGFILVWSRPNRTAKAE